jgi:hypothetical protein
MKEYTLIFLMDICGHPGISEDFVERYRTYALQDIINDSYLDRKKCVIVSTGFLPYEENPRSHELYKQAVLDRGWTWLTIDKTDNFSKLEYMLNEIDFVLSPEKTNIIYGGTNTSGCVLNSSNFSLNKFCDKGYSCQLYLPLCDDAQVAGITSHDKNLKAFALVYSYLKLNNYIKDVDILTRFADLKLIRSNKRFDYIST